MTLDGNGYALCTHDYGFKTIVDTGIVFVLSTFIGGHSSYPMRNVPLLAPLATSKLVPASQPRRESTETQTDTCKVSQKIKRFVVNS